MIAQFGSLDAAALYRRVTIRLLPFLVLCYIVSVIDRLNIAMAKLQMLPALGFSEAAYGLGAGVFFLGYLIFDVPSNLIMQRVGARWWIGRIMISWGIVSVATAFVHTTFWFYVARFLLGAAEAGFFAGLLMYLTYWFPASQRGRAYSILLLAAPLAGVVGNPLAGWIMTQFNGSAGLGGWQWLFVAEGLPAVVLGVISLRVLGTGPDNAGWLTPAEWTMIRAHLDADEAVKPPAKAMGFLTSPLVWLMCAICFGISAGMYAVGFWLPTLIHATGVPERGGDRAVCRHSLASCDGATAGWRTPGGPQWGAAVVGGGAPPGVRPSLGGEYGDNGADAGPGGADDCHRRGADLPRTVLEPARDRAFRLRGGRRPGLDQLGWQPGRLLHALVHRHRERRDRQHGWRHDRRRLRHCPRGCADTDDPPPSRGWSRPDRG